MEIIFISYNGALEPLSLSQVIPYIIGLSAKGFKLRLLSFERKRDSLDKGSVKNLDIKLKHNGIAWHRLVYHKKPAVISTIYDIFIGTVYCACLLLRRKRVILHARSYAPAVIAYILNKLFGVRFIFDMRGMMVDEYAEAGIIKKGGLISKIGKAMEKRMLLSCVKVVVLTEKIKGIIQNFPYMRHKGSAGIEVIPCCVDLHRFAYNPQGAGLFRKPDLNGKFIFLYTGSVGTWYFLDGMLDLFAAAKTKIPDAHFLILSREDKDFIRKSILAKNLRLSDFTITEDQHENIPQYISGCRVGVIFYKQVFSRLACSPVKFAEYLACGVPVIINSGVGDTEELVKANRIGAVVKEFMRDNYNSAIDSILEVLKDGQALRQRCRDVASSFFSLGYGINKYAAIYQEEDK